MGWSPASVEECLQEPLVTEALNARGIRVTKSPELLSPEQLVAMGLFFDTKDGRSLKKKFADAGITTQQWDAWKKEPVFAQHLRTRAEGILQSSIAETEVALVDSAQRGDFNAMKLHLEMAGRWSSKTVGELNVEFLLMKILEAVQKHVKDPQAIENIAGEIAALAPARPGEINSSAVVTPLRELPL